MTTDIPRPTVLPTPDLDETTIAEIRVAAMKDATRRIPARWRQATVTISAIADWTIELVADAVCNRGKRDPFITEGRSLLLAGGVGSGKTHNAYGAIWALAASGANCSWRLVTMADAFDSLRPSAGPDARAEFHSLATTGLLVLDDVGAAKTSEWTEEILFRLINHRYDHLAPTLITTNLTRLAPALGDRVASRLTQMCTQITMPGPDRRKAKP